MRRVRYHVAMSLDGFIAGPQGEYDWLIADPEIDIANLFRAFGKKGVRPLGFSVF